MCNEKLNNYIMDPDSLTRKYFQNKKFCMAYNKSECSDHICDAHTISKKYLKNITDNGHVYMPTGSFHHKNNFFEFSLTGIQKATRISGFCKFHDDFLFQSFEKSDFSGNYRQIYDLTFRALCREYFQKKCLLCFFHDVTQGKYSDFDKTGYFKSHEFKQALSHLEKELRDYKFIYNQLKKCKTSGLCFLLIETKKLPLSTTGVIFPLVDSEGNKIQSEKQKQLGFIYSIIPLNKKSYIVISSVKSLHNNLHKNFLFSLKKIHGNKIINYLITYFFWNNDNITLNPSWMDKQDSYFKEKINSLMNIGVSNYTTTKICVDLVDFCNTFSSGNLITDIRYHV